MALELQARWRSFQSELLLIPWYWRSAGFAGKNFGAQQISKRQMSWHRTFTGFLVAELEIILAAHLYAVGTKLLPIFAVVIALICRQAKGKDVVSKASVIDFNCA